MFCNKCGTNLPDNAPFCGQCGAQTATTQAPPAPAYPAAYGAAVSTANNFTQRLHSFSASGLFLVGCILYSGGLVLAMIMEFSFLSIIPLAFVALPIIGMWMLYAASKNPSVPEKSLTSLTLFKVIAVISLVLVCIGTGAAVLGMLFALTGGAALVDFLGAGESLFAIMVIIFLIITALLILIIIYYVSLLKVIKSIRHGILYNNIKEIRGVGFFTIFGIILVSMEILGNLATLSAQVTINNFWSDLVWMIRWEFGPEVASIFNDLMPLGGIDPLPIILSIAASLGMLLMLVTLRKFSASIHQNPPH